MSFRLVAAAATILFIAGCSTMKIDNDYDREADFSSYKSYTWQMSDMTLVENFPLAHERVVSAIEAQLAIKGFSKVDANPDVYINYHTDEDEEIRLDTDQFGYGYGPGWYWGRGMGSSTTTVRSYTRGTIVVDIWDAKEKRLVWRGVASDTVSENPGSDEKKINRAAQKMFEKYPPAGE